MISLILYGDLNDNKLTRYLLRQLEGSYNVTHQTQHKLVSYLVNGSKKEILVLETDSLKIIDSSDTIIIFKNVTNQPKFRVLNNARIIVFSQNKIALDFLKQNGYKDIITFGYGQDDVLTSSSFGSDQKTICLQNKIKTISGNIITPLEFTVTDEIDILTLLPIYGVKILLDHYLD